MAQVEPGDAHDEMKERQAKGRDCACPHWDAQECYRTRYPWDHVDREDHVREVYGEKASWKGLRVVRAPEFDQWAEVDATGHAWDEKMLPRNT